MEYCPTILRMISEENSDGKNRKKKNFPWSGTDKTSDIYCTVHV
jgi:hypothetical protein